MREESASIATVAKSSNVLPSSRPLPSSVPPAAGSGARKGDEALLKKF